MNGIAQQEALHKEQVERQEHQHKKDMEVIIEKLQGSRATDPVATHQAAIPPFPAFDSSTELWPDYWSRFCTFLEANGVPELRKAQVFLTNQTPAIYKQLSNLAAQQSPPTEINKLSLEEIVDFMKAQFDPKLFVVRERFKFWSNMERKPGETLQELAARIRQDAATCDFPLIKDPQDEALRQRFICSVNNEAVLKAIFKVKDTDLTFAKAIQTAIETEDAAKVAKETVYGSKPRPVNKVHKNTRGGQQKGKKQSDSTEMKCYRCGDKRHRATDCKYKEAKCNFCEKIGHLEAVCKKKLYKQQQWRRILQ